MKQKITLPYYCNGDRNYKCFENPSNDTLSTSCVKTNSSDIIERNFLDFDSRLIKRNSNLSNSQLFYHPEYKRYHVVNEMNQNINNYMNPVQQYKYKDNPLIQSSDGLFSLRKEKLFIKGEYLNNQNNKQNINPSQSENNLNIKNDKNNIIQLKAERNQNILQPNILHVKAGHKSLRRIKPPSLNPDFDLVKSGSYLESKDAPEYLRNYDRENIKNIDQYYIDKDQNVTVLSRFGSWLTLRPNDKNRKHSLEKIKQGTYETSIIAPDWMDIQSRRKNNPNMNLNPVNNFKSYQWTNSCKDNTKVTMLIEKDQKNALPDFLKDYYN
jgi:hypothetical protein